MITANIPVTHGRLFALWGLLRVINHSVIHHLSHTDDTAAPVWCINSNSVCNLPMCPSQLCCQPAQTPTNLWIIDQDPVFPPVSCGFLWYQINRFPTAQSLSGSGGALKHSSSVFYHLWRSQQVILRFYHFILWMQLQFNILLLLLLLQNENETCPSDRDHLTQYF